MNYERVHSFSEVERANVKKAMVQKPKEILSFGSIDIESVLKQFQLKPVSEGKVGYVDALGGITQKKFYSKVQWHAPFTLENQLQPHAEEIFDWIELLRSVIQDKNDFTMAELGCGYGRWLGFATAALRQLGKTPTALLGVEAEPTHFKWAKEHLLMNGAPADRIHLIKGAVGNEGGKLFFTVGNPSGWYGQSLTYQGPRRHGIVGNWMNRITLPFLETKLHYQKVRSVNLSSFLYNRRKISLVHMDVQGVEAKVIHEARHIFNDRVGKVHIRTHGALVEEALRKHFTQANWIKVWDFPSCATSETPKGKITFSDGVQTWVNPRF